MYAPWPMQRLPLLGGVGRRSSALPSPGDQSLVSAPTRSPLCGLPRSHRVAALARECEQMKLEIRPLIALRTNAGCYRPFPRGSAQGCGGL